MFRFTESSECRVPLLKQSENLQAEHSDIFLNLKDFEEI